MFSFSRTPEPPTVSGIRPMHVANSNGRIAKAQEAGRLIATDLSLGACRSHQAACELRSQLGLPGIPEPASLQTEEDAYPIQSAMSHLTDLELQGDRVVLQALRFAVEVRTAIEASRFPLLIAVILPRFGKTLDRCDSLFLRFLLQSLRSTRHEFLLVASEDDDCAIPVDWMVHWDREPMCSPIKEVDNIWRLVPGIVTRDIIEAIDAPLNGTAGFALPEGRFLIPPVLRRNPAAIAPECWDGLASLDKMPPWVASYAMCHCRPRGVNGLFLTNRSYIEFQSGGLEIALRLLDRAIAFAPSHLHRGLSELLSQGIRIIAGQFDTAAELNVPQRGLPPLIRGFLLMTKGWALTMSDRPGAAEPFLNEAKSLLRECPFRQEYLCLVNITALARLKQGDWEGAMASERCISENLVSFKNGAWQVKYIKIGRAHV